MTTQQYMIAVIAVAMLIWGEQTRRRWLAYREGYRASAYFEEESRKEASNPTVGFCAMVRPSEASRQRIKAEYSDYMLRTANRYAGVKNMYARAMFHPWDLAPPEPPFPDE